MSRSVAKEFLHLREWLGRATQLVDTGNDAYEANSLLQEAGDSLMMKIGETANRLDRAGVEPPAGVRWSDAVSNRNWLIHQYDEIDREVTWATLTKSLPSWEEKLGATFEEAAAMLAGAGTESRSTVLRKKPFGTE